MTMYERIKELRLSKGLSQQKLAEITGYQDRSSIAKIESGTVDLPQSKIVLFAQVLGVSPAVLMGLVDPEPLNLSPHERALILAYRSQPHMQEAVDRLLAISSEGVQKKQA